MTRRVLITGSRTWTDAAGLRAVLSSEWGDGTAVLVTGAARMGADYLAELFWSRWGGHVERHPANWDRYGKAAGFRRDAEMVALGADVCLAFIREEVPRGHAHRLASRGRRHRHPALHRLTGLHRQQTRKPAEEW